MNDILRTIDNNLYKVVKWLFTYDEDNQKIMSKNPILINKSSNENIDEKFNEYEIINTDYCNETSNIIITTETVLLDISTFSSADKRIFAQMVIIY